MKAKMLSRFNALIALLMGILGFSVTGCAKKYGVPHAELEVSGTVTNQADERLEQMRVTVKQDGRQVLPKTYTNESGRYLEQGYVNVPQSTVDIIVEDPSGIYAPDSIRLAVSYEKTKESKKDEWNRGKATVQQDFQLKKK